MLTMFNSEIAVCRPLLNNNNKIWSFKWGDDNFYGSDDENVS